MAFVNESKLAFELIVAFAYLVILMKTPKDVLLVILSKLIDDEGVALVTNSSTNDIYYHIRD